MPYSQATQALVDARKAKGKQGIYTIDTYLNGTSTHTTVQGTPFDSSPNAKAFQPANPNDPYYRRSDIAPFIQATNKDVMGAGNYGVRGWLKKHPVGAIAAFVALAAGGAVAAGSLGGGSAGGASGANLGVFSNGGTAGIGGVGGGNAGAVAAGGGISGGAGVSGASGIGGVIAKVQPYAKYAQIGLNLGSTISEVQAAGLNKKAAAQQEIVVGRQQASERRQLIREIYIARAESVAASAASSTGALQSSAPLGANSSILSQGTFNIKYFDAQAESQRLYRKYLSKGQDKSNQADLLATGAKVIGALFS